MSGNRHVAAAQSQASQLWTDTPDAEVLAGGFRVYRNKAD